MASSKWDTTHSLAATEAEPTETDLRNVQIPYNNHFTAGADVCLRLF